MMYYILILLKLVGKLHIIHLNICSPIDSVVYEESIGDFDSHFVNRNIKEIIKNMILLINIPP